MQNEHNTACGVFGNETNTGMLVDKTRKSFGITSHNEIIIKLALQEITPTID